MINNNDNVTVSFIIYVKNRTTTTIKISETTATNMKATNNLKESTNTIKTTAARESETVTTTSPPRIQWHFHIIIPIFILTFLTILVLVSIRLRRQICRKETAPPPTLTYNIYEDIHSRPSSTYGESIPQTYDVPLSQDHRNQSRPNAREGSPRQIPPQPRRSLPDTPSFGWPKILTFGLQMQLASDTQILFLHGRIQQTDTRWPFSSNYECYRTILIFQMKIWQ